MGDGDSKGFLRVTHNVEWRFVRLSRSPEEAVSMPESPRK